MGLNLGGVTASVVEYALDGLSLRHAAIATNIANANSVGYRPMQVSFEDALADFVARESSSSSGQSTVSDLPRPVLAESAAGPLPATVNSVEMQTVLLHQNVLRYQALITGLNKYLSTVSIAINEGKK